MENNSLHLSLIFEFFHDFFVFNTVGKFHLLYQYLTLLIQDLKLYTKKWNSFWQPLLLQPLYVSAAKSKICRTTQKTQNSPTGPANTLCPDIRKSTVTPSRSSPNSLSPNFRSMRNYFPPYPNSIIFSPILRGISMKSLWKGRHQHYKLKLVFLSPLNFSQNNKKQSISNSCLQWNHTITNIRPLPESTNFFFFISL